MVLNVHRYDKDYWGQGEGGMEVGGEGDYIPKKSYRYSVTTRMTSALR